MTGVQTCALPIWVRGHLTSQYGVDFSRVKWVQGAVESADTHGKPSAPPLLVPVEIEQNHSGHSLDELLARGEIDALIGSRKPASLGKHPDVARLFPNFRQLEREMFMKEKIFPIMHLIALRRDFHERNPWVANSLFRAFVESKALAAERLRYAGSLCTDRKSTRLNSSHIPLSRMPSSA